MRDLWLENEQENCFLSNYQIQYAIHKLMVNDAFIIDINMLVPMLRQT